MSQYILSPGAELEIGPGGKPYETLGACCSSCSKGGLSGFTVGGFTVSNTMIGAAAVAAAAYFAFFRKKRR